MNRTVKFNGVELQLLTESGLRGSTISATFAMNDGSFVTTMRLKFWSHGELEINVCNLTIDELEQINELGEQPRGIWQLPSPNIQYVLEQASA